MRNLIPLRYLIAITFCITAIISTGCSAIITAMTYQQVDTELLEKNRDKTFKIGIVQATGKPDQMTSIKDALDNIRIAEICSILSSRYSITIDANVDKTVRFSKREEEDWEYDYKGRARPVTRTMLNAYYGNPINTTEFPGVVNVTYTTSDYPMYDIKITSSKQKIISLQGHIDNAGRIGEALKRDLLNRDRFDESVRTGHINDGLKKDLKPF